MKLPTPVLVLWLVLSCGGEPQRGGWAADVGALVDGIERLHPEPYRATPRSQFEAAAASLRRALPALDEEAAAIGLLRLVALVRDPGTRIDADDILAREELPVRVQRFEDGWFAVRAAASGTPALGARLVAIEGRPIEQVLDLVAQLVPHDNRAYFESAAPAWLARPAVLFALGVAPREGALRLLFEDSARGRFALSVEPVARERAAALVWRTSRDAARGAAPLWLCRSDTAVWWTPVGAKQAVAYLQVNRLEDEPAGAFARALGEVLGALDGGRALRLAIDLRHAQCGDPLALRSLAAGIRARPELDRADRVFVLVGPGTFGAGVAAALDLCETHALVLGEATSMRPNSLGAPRSFALPQSGLWVECSTRSFLRVPGDPEALVPDVRLPLSHADFLAGRDPVLAWVLAVN